MTWTNINSGTATFADGSSGYSYSLPSGAPSVGQLDILCINSDTIVETPSTTGAAWVLGPTDTSGNQGAYLWYLVATGGESSSITITTSGNYPTQVSWSRFSAYTITADANAIAHEDNADVETTPAVSTGTLSQAGELSVAFAALHGMQATSLSNPVWSSPYAAMTADQSGNTSTDVAAFVAYNPDAGTAAETPNVSWTTNATDAYILVQTFEPGTAPQVPGATVLYSMRTFP